MAFGFGKKKEGASKPSSEEAEKAEQTLPYGGASDDDESSFGASVPPPPPTMVSESNLYQNDSPADADAAVNDKDEGENEDGGETLRNDDSFSALVDDSMLDEQTEAIEAQDMGLESFEARETAKTDIRRKKALVMVLCAASFAILVGLAVGYGRKQSSSSPSNSSMAASTEGGGSGSDGGVETGPSVNGTFVPSFDANATESGSTEEPVATADPADPSATDEPIGTDTPTDGDINGTEDPSATATDEPIGTDTPTDGDNNGTEDPSATEEPVSACDFDTIFAEAECVDGTTTVTVRMCVAGVVTDQFWQWMDTPAEYQNAAETWDWDWMSSGLEFTKVDLPEGTYSVGIFAGGEQTLADLGLDEYPLLAGTQFTLTCA